MVQAPVGACNTGGQFQNLRVGDAEPASPSSHIEGHYGSWEYLWSHALCPSPSAIFMPDSTAPLGLPGCRGCSWELFGRESPACPRPGARTSPEAGSACSLDDAKQHGLILITLPHDPDPFIRRHFLSHPSPQGSGLLTQLQSSMESRQHSISPDAHLSSCCPYTVHKPHAWL